MLCLFLCVSSLCVSSHSHYRPQRIDPRPPVLCVTHGSASDQLTARRYYTSLIERDRETVGAY